MACKFAACCNAFRRINLVMSDPPKTLIQPNGRKDDANGKTQTTKSACRAKRRNGSRATN